MIVLCYGQRNFISNVFTKLKHSGKKITQKTFFELESQEYEKASIKK